MNSRLTVACSYAKHSRWIALTLRHLATRSQNGRVRQTNKPMPTYKSFDVVGVPFSFTENQAHKRRPALILSKAVGTKDSRHYLLGMITGARNTPSRWTSTARLTKHRFVCPTGIAREAVYSRSTINTSRNRSFSSRRSSRCFSCSNINCALVIRQKKARHCRAYVDTYIASFNLILMMIRSGTEYPAVRSHGRQAG